MTTTILSRIQEFASRKKAFSIGVSEFFVLLSHIVKYTGSLISGASISMIYQLDVPNLSKLEQIKNPKKGWAARVLDQVNGSGRAYMYQFDGGAWNRTPFFVFPDDVATHEDLNLQIKSVSNYVFTETIIGKDSNGLNIWRRGFDAHLNSRKDNEESNSMGITISDNVDNLWVDNASFVTTGSHTFHPFTGLGTESFPVFRDELSAVPRIETTYNRTAPQLTLKAFDVPNGKTLIVQGFVCYTRKSEQWEF